MVKVRFWIGLLVVEMAAGFAGGLWSTLSPPQSVAGNKARLEVLTRSDVWLDADGKPQPLQDEESLLDYLRTAVVISDQILEEGINKSRKVLLERDGIRMNAAFRDVRVRKPKATMKDGSIKRNFRDDCLFEVAAYRLARLMGLKNVPPTVERKIDGKRGSLQVWVEKSMTEGSRLEKNISPPNKEEWLLQWQIVRLFDNLIYNDDRNPGNTLTDPAWKLWMIDHTRAFSESRETLHENLVIHCEREVWDRLRALDKKVLMGELKGLLEERQVEALLARRDLLVAHIRGRLERLGEEEVLF